ncbi:uncharacterized, partial [Tachysurus ichikawai]
MQQEIRIARHDTDANFPNLGLSLTAIPLLMSRSAMESNDGPSIEQLTEISKSGCAERACCSLPREESANDIDRGRPGCYRQGGAWSQVDLSVKDLWCHKSFRSWSHPKRFP